MSRWDLPEIMHRTGRILLSGLEVAVHVKAAKTVFGERRALISPVAGSGEQWVPLKRVRLDREEEGQDARA